MNLRSVVLALLVLASVCALAIGAQRPGGPGAVDLEKDPFVGITTDGSVQTGLFATRSTGVSTRPVMDAAARFIAALTPEQRKATTFAVDDLEWRRWNNVHRAERSGTSFKEMTDAQRASAYALLQAGLSAKGLEKTRNVMRLNETIAELTNKFTEYGEGLYNLTVMGEPSMTEPWGWQLEGHHLVINYFVLGDQVVMTPAFWGSEPVTAESGKYAGTSVLQDEQNLGLAFMQSLTADQQRQATIAPGKKTANNAQTQAYRDNVRLPYAGIKASELNEKQRKALLDLIGEYVHNMAEGHARVRMTEVRAHLDTTHFGWIGETAADSVFYYRIHSPVILIEFDHQTPVALPGPREPGRRHIHSVVRTPNGNDYGKDLLRQHYLEHKHDAWHGHVQAPW
ncbi:MAG TPA: DUF3500 domain-containing protein [Vicinamibacterales bacterium]|nr:DUF3500 domain-containing protein [Vicinamibacterales bacterium]